MSGAPMMTRKSVVAGRFYPNNPESLRTQVKTCLASPPQRSIVFSQCEVLAVMVPHAGYVFSGAIAGMTLAQNPLPESIFLLGPNHTGMGRSLAVWAEGEWETPLGMVAVDTELAGELLDHGAGFVADTSAHSREHSLEVVLPFLQVHAPKTRVVPIVVGGQPIATLKASGEALAAVMRKAAAQGKKTAIIVSSDMSHYLPHEVCAKQDSVALDALCSLEPEVFYSTVRERGISMCGVHPMTVALYACTSLGATSADVIAYATSGQTGKAFGADMNKVVGYAGVIISRKI